MALLVHIRGRIVDLKTGVAVGIPDVEVAIAPVIDEDEELFVRDGSDWYKVQHPGTNKAKTDPNGWYDLYIPVQADQDPSDTAWLYQEPDGTKAQGLPPPAGTYTLKELKDGHNWVVS